MKTEVFKAVGRSWGRGILVAGIAAASAGILAGASVAAPSAADLIKVRFGGDGQSTRIVLDLAESAQAKIVSISPTSFVFDLPKVSATDLQGAGQGLVKAWSADSRPGATRIKLELDRPATVERRFLLAPGEGMANYRYVIDLKPADAVKAAPVVVASKAPPPATKSPDKPAKPANALVASISQPTGPVSNFPTGFSFGSRAEAAPLPVKTVTRTASQIQLKKTVVIDPGHGGHDPGALGANAREKDLTLQAALAVKARLEATGRYRVVMTRSTDVFIPLENRVQIARKANADLFISMHADAGANKATRGASVYTLSDQGSQRVVKGVSRDSDWFSNLNLTGATKAVREIIMDLTQRATRNQSAQFADILLQRLNGHAPLLTRAHRDAGYMVLLAPDVPAVLLEMGFVTNLDDEKFLSTADTRAKLAGAVAAAIDDYFDAGMKVAMN